jgi:putative pyruvate formate lyase activating enzyme
MQPYFALYQSGELLTRIRDGYRRLSACDLCPHRCGVNRIKGEQGTCRSALLPRIASANLHRGEEPPISGSKGSGTIFFTGCTLRCVFCQNFPISQQNSGETISTVELARRMLQLQKRGAHNINLVTPTHWLPQFLSALWLAIPQGLDLPVVWNSSGYESVDALQLLDGIVSIYLPDMKYSDDVAAVALSAAPEYSQVNRLAVMEMLRQVGHLQLDDTGIATQGLIIRHLVLPQGRAGSAETLHWIAELLGFETHIALMSQYFPAHNAGSMEGINRPLSAAEYDAATKALEAAGLDNGWVQELDQERISV